jgi:hypothetical protein
MVSFTPLPLYLRRKSSWYPLDRRLGLDDVEKRIFLTLSALELGSLGPPALSQSLYRLRYPGSFYPMDTENKAAGA